MSESLTPEEYEQVRELFAELLELGAEQRREHLQALEVDPRIRDATARLLEQESVEAFDEENLGSIAPALFAFSDPERLEGEAIGVYRIVRRLGEGGMGVVYLAEQQYELEDRSEPVVRQVALKLMRPGMQRSAEVVARFEAERVALARMDHPYIASVLDCATADSGAPYFVMEYVRGASIVEYCDRKQVSTDQRLELFVKVCQGVQHAHQKGVIHRDLKPSNVLVVEHDGIPTPKIIDFGIAKSTTGSLTDQAALTAVQQLVGTLDSMAPEQAMSADIDTRADVYALGALLYELLTGAKPLNLDTEMRNGYDRAVRAIREEEPVRPSLRVAVRGVGTQRVGRRLSSILRGDLDWIVLRALEKDRERRYESASEFAADVRRYLSSEPVVARPQSRLYRLRKAIRRNRVAFGFVLVLFLVLTLGVVGTGIGLSSALEANKRLEVEKGRTETQLRRVASVRDVLLSMIDAVDPRVASGADTTLLRSMVADVEARLRDGSVSDPWTVADLRDAVGRVYEGLGDYGACLKYFEAAYQTAGLEPTSLPSITARLDATRVRIARGELAAAEGLLDTIQADADLDRLPSIALDVVRQRTAIAWSTPKARQAVAALEAAADKARSVLGATDRSLSAALMSLGAYYGDLFEPEKAERCYEEVLARYQHHFGAEHVANYDVRSAMASLLADQQRFVEAEHATDLVVQAYERFLGPHHPVTLMERLSLALIWVRTGRSERAAPVIEEVLALPDDVLSGTSTRRTRLRSMLATYYLHSGQFERSLAVFEDVLRDERKYGRSGVGNGVSLRNNLVRLYAQSGRFREAEELALESLPLVRGLLGEEHYMTLILRSHIAYMYLAKGEPRRGLADARVAFQKLLDLRGPSAPFTASAGSVLQNILHACGLENEVYDICERALAAARERVDDHNADAEALVSVARQLLEHPMAALRDPSAALVYATRARDLAPDNPFVYLVVADACEVLGYRVGESDALDAALKHIGEESPLREIVERRLSGQR